MIFRTLPRACSTMLSVLLLLTFSLPSTWSRVFAREGDPDGGPFNETVYYPWSLQQTDEGCSSGSSATLMSPNGNFTLKLNVVCPDRTMDPWNLSFVAGVGRRFPDLFQTDGTLQFPLQGWAWTVPVGFDQPTNSCALRFTATGDFQFVVPNLKRGDSPYPPWRQERILWRTNTSGLGAVEMQVLSCLYLRRGPVEYVPLRPAKHSRAREEDELHGAGKDLNLRQVPTIFYCFKEEQGTAFHHVNETLWARYPSFTSMGQIPLTSSEAQT